VCFLLFLQLLQNKVKCNWQRTAVTVTFVRAHRTHALRSSVLPLLSLIGRIANPLQEREEFTFE
jgi:hypothetical protein